MLKKNLFAILILALAISSQPVYSGNIGIGTKVSDNIGINVKETDGIGTKVSDNIGTKVSNNIYPKVLNKIGAGGVKEGEPEPPRKKLEKPAKEVRRGEECIECAVLFIISLICYYALMWL